MRTCERRASFAVGVGFVLRGLQQPGAQHPQAGLAVLQLALLVLHRHDGAGRDVRDAHGRVGGVDALPARAGRAEHVDAQVVRVDLDLDVLGLGQHQHAGGGGVDAPLRLGGGHALHAVHAALVLQPGPRAVLEPCGRGRRRWPTSCRRGRSARRRAPRSPSPAARHSACTSGTGRRRTGPTRRRPRPP